MKAVLDSELLDEKEEFELAMRGARSAAALDDVWDKVFRPYRKHGYAKRELQGVIDANPEVASKIVEGLIEIYLEVLKED